MSEYKWRLKPYILEIYIAKRYYTKSEFCKEIGISPSYLSQWLSLQKSPGPEYRKKILKAMSGRDVKYETFFECYETTQTTGIDCRNRQ